MNRRSAVRIPTDCYNRWLEYLFAGQVLMLLGPDLSAEWT